MPFGFNSFVAPATEVIVPLSCGAPGVAILARLASSIASWPAAVVLGRAALSWLARLAVVAASGPTGSFDWAAAPVCAKHSLRRHPPSLLLRPLIDSLHASSQLSHIKTI